MHTGALRKWALALTFWLALHTSSLRAQTTLTLPTTGSSGSVLLQFRLDGSIIEEGSGTSTLSNSDLESSSRFIWYPVQSALRAGAGLSTETVSEVGQYSVAFGQHSIASGPNSVAFGGGSTASGSNSMALGYATTASNYNTVALNQSTTASGLGATSMGGSSTASGTFSIAGGYITQASGWSSFSMGGLSLASGSYSTALEYQTSASGNYSTALGYQSSASGNVSTAIGLHAAANSYGSVVVGTYNVDENENGSTPSLTSWVGTSGAADPLFEIGDGTSSAPSDALAVYKDGVVAVHTKLRAYPGGDLSMGNFTAGSPP